MNLTELEQSTPAMEGTRTNTRISRQWQETTNSRTPPLRNLWSKHWAYHMATVLNLSQLSRAKHLRRPTTGTHKLAHTRHTTKLTTPFNNSPTMTHGRASGANLSMNALSSAGHSKGLSRHPTERRRQALLALLGPTPLHLGVGNSLAVSHLNKIINGIRTAYSKP